LNQSHSELCRFEGYFSFLSNISGDISYFIYATMFFPLNDFSLRLFYTSRVIAANSVFESFLIYNIILSALVSGIQTYPRFSNSSLLQSVDHFIFGVYCVDFLVRVLSHGWEPNKYFTGPAWKSNLSDFVILLITTPILNKSSIFRSLRLLRLMKLVRRIKQVRILMKSLYVALKSSVYVFSLIILIFVFYSILGLSFFRENDRFHFPNFTVAFITMFRILSMDGWSELYFVNAVGCDSYYNSVYKTPSAETPLFPYYSCQHAHPQPVLSAIYFFSIIIITVFVMLSVFIGVITIGMEDSIETMRYEKEQRRINYVQKRKQIVLDSMRLSESGNNSAVSASARSSLSSSWFNLFHSASTSAPDSAYSSSKYEPR